MSPENRFGAAFRLLGGWPFALAAASTFGLAFALASQVAASTFSWPSAGELFPPMSRTEYNASISFAFLVHVVGFAVMWQQGSARRKPHGTLKPLWLIGCGLLLMGMVVVFRVSMSILLHGGL